MLIIKNLSDIASTKQATKYQTKFWDLQATIKKEILNRKILKKYNTYDVNSKCCLLSLNKKLQITLNKGVY